MLDSGPRLWAVILAGGFHRRLSAITSALAGVDTPLAAAAESFIACAQAEERTRADANRAGPPLAA